jgi:hypothetical protein
MMRKRKRKRRTLWMRPWVLPPKTILVVVDLVVVVGLVGMVSLGLDYCSHLVVVVDYCYLKEKEEEEQGSESGQWTP